MSRSDEYFAALPAEEVGKEIYGKVQSYYSEIDTSGYFEMIRRSYYNYYGNSSQNNSVGRVFQSSGIRRGGVQGELYDFKVNHYRNLIQHLLTMTTSEKVALEAMAVNTDYDSQIQSELGGGLLEYYLVEKRLERFLVEACEKSLWSGAGHVGVFWNTSKGNKYAVQNGQMLYDGDLEYKIYNPLDVILDPHSHSRYTNWKIVREYENKWDLAAEYPELKDEILKMPTKEMELSRYTLSKGYGGMESDDIPVYHFFHEKTPAVPNGRQTSILPGGKVYFDGPLPYKKLPIYSLMPSRIEGTPYGYTVGFDLLSLQEALDILYSTILTNQACFGVQNIWMPKGHDVRVQSLGGGLKVIETDPKVGKPEPLNLTQTPPELFKFISELEMVMEKIAGLNSVVRGQPSGQLSGASGAAMALLASQAIQFSYGLQREYEFLVEDIGTASLQTLQTYANTERIALIVGKSKKSYTKKFSSKDIDKLDRAVVKRTSAISRTTAGKADIAKTLIDAGMIKTPDEYLTVLKTGNLEPIMEGDRAELLLIKSENENLRTGQPVTVIATDKHTLHILEHKCVVADPDTRSQPQVLAGTLAHIQEHIMALKTTDPQLLALLGETPLQMPMPMGPPGMGAPGAETMQTANEQLPEAMPNLPSMPTNPLTGEKYTSPVEAANTPGAMTPPV